MKKIFAVLSSLLVLVGCASTPTQPQDKLFATLTGAQEVNLVMPDQPATTAARFTTKGYTIIGAAFVAAAVAKMNSQTEELTKKLNAYSTERPDVQSLNGAFLEQVKQNLAARGIKSNVYSSFDAADKNLPTLHVSNLRTYFLAASSTDAYKHAASAEVKVMAPNAKGAPEASGLVSVEISETKLSQSYDNFGVITSNFPKSYDGLVASSKELADKVVGKVRP